jgi:hypothetical protein
MLPKVRVRGYGHRGRIGRGLRQPQEREIEAVRSGGCDLGAPSYHRRGDAGSLIKQWEIERQLDVGRRLRWILTSKRRLHDVSAGEDMV